VIGFWVMFSFEQVSNFNTVQDLYSQSPQNVYVTHHGTNSTHPPLIGLLNLTNPSSAMLQFRLERGPDPLEISLPSSAQIRNIIPMSPKATPKVIYAIATLGGFLGGIIVTVLLRSRLKKRGGRRDKEIM
jgi:hypothetical protein